jgi:hypothetical protein
VQGMWNIKFMKIQAMLWTIGIVTRGLKKFNKFTIAILVKLHVIKGVLQSESLNLSGGDHCWFKKRSRNKRPVTRDEIMLTLSLVCSVLLRPHPSAAFLPLTGVQNKCRFTCTEQTAPAGNYVQMTVRNSGFFFWNLLNDILVVPGIWRWFLHFWKKFWNFHYKNNLQTVNRTHMKQTQKQKICINNTFTRYNSPLVGPGRPHYRGFTIKLRLGYTAMYEWPARRRDLYLTAHNNHNRDIHAPGWIRTRNPNKRAAADPRLRPRNHRNRLNNTLRHTELN